MKNELGKLEKNYVGLRPVDGGGIYISSFVIMYMVQVLLSLLIFEIRNTEGGLTIGEQFAINAVTQICLFATPIIYGLIVRKPMIQPVRFRKGINIKQIGLLVAISVFAIVAFYPLANAFQLFMQWTGYAYTPSEPPTDTAGNLVLSLIFVSLMPAIGEEFLFRGSIARALKKKSYLYAVLVSSLMFAVFHGNALQIVHQFLLGCVCAYCYFITGSIYSTMLVHFLNNAIVLLIMYIFGNSISVSAGALIGISVAMVIVGFAVLYLLLRCLTKVSKERAGIECGKTDIKDYFRDIGAAFTIKGIKENSRKLNENMRTLYDDPTDNEVEKTEVDQHEDVKNDKTRQMLIEADKAAIHKRRIADRNIVLLAVAMGVIVLVINIINHYIAD